MFFIYDRKLLVKRKICSVQKNFSLQNLGFIKLIMIKNRYPLKIKGSNDFVKYLYYLLGKYRIIDMCVQCNNLNFRV